MAATSRPEAAASIAQAAIDAGVTVSVAESLTGGLIASALSATADAAAWFAGGVVAYREETKFRVLDVDPGPVISERAAVQMVRGCCQLFSSPAAIAVTGAGGPGPQEGHRAGTVFLAASAGGEVVVQERWFAGDPEAVVQQTIDAGLQLLAETLTRHDSAGSMPRHASE